MKKIIFISMIILTIFMVGCAKKPAVPTTGGTTDVDKDVSALDSEISQVDTTNNDLNSADIDSLDDDFAEVNW